MTAYLAPPIRQLFLNPSTGAPAVKFLLFQYAAGTTTKVNTYINSGGNTPNLNPIVMDSLGECDLWLQPGIAYKFVFSPPTDTDPPTNPIWTRDNVSAAGTAFTTFASAVAADLLGYSLIYIQGYYSPGDGGGAYWKQVSAIPNHLVYFIAADGAIYEIAEADIDPRMFGARADVAVWQDAAIAAGSLNVVTINDPGFGGFVQGDLGKNIVVWDYPFVHTLINSTITNILSVNSVQVASGSATPTTGNCDVFYGSDDTAVITACITASGYPSSGFISEPPVSPRQTSEFNTWLQGGHTIVFKSYDQNSGRYGVSSEIDLINGTTLKGDPNSCLYALGTFTGNMIGQQAPGGVTYPIGATLDGMTLCCNGFANLGLINTNSIYFTIRNGITVTNGLNGGIQLGIIGTNSVSTLSIGGKVHVEGISSKMSGWINNPTAIGIYIANGPDSKISGDIEVINYRTGMIMQSGDFDGTAQVHIWTNANGGYLTLGMQLNSTDINFQKVFIDTPWGPAGTVCYGVILNGFSGNIDHLSVALNTNAAPGTADNSVVAVQYLNQDYSAPGTFATGKTGSSIGTIWTQTGNSSVRLKQVVDTHLASNIALDIGTINTDGNVYDIGWSTPTQRALQSMATNIASLSNLVVANAKLIISGATPASSALWTPAEDSNAVVFWLDSSYSAYYNNDGAGRTVSWNSRNGRGRAVQSGITQRPTIGATAWAGSGITSQPAMTFNGTNQYIFLDDIIVATGDVRMYAVIIPQTTGAQGPVMSFNNTTFNGQLAMASNGTQIGARDNSGNGNFNTVTAGVPILVTAVWSTTSAEGTGMFSRINGGTNTGVVALSAKNLPVMMGGFVTGNVVSETVQFVLAEHIVTIGSQSLAHEQLYEGYLAWKWWTAGSTILPGGHPYHSAPPAA